MKTTIVMNEKKLKRKVKFVAAQIHASYKKNEIESKVSRLIYFFLQCSREGCKIITVLTVFFI